ncbi:MAG: hypothetical protein GWP91_06290 [Rhodobacterales bacterium]|nr:hypothetical protein [Rhodobacterales bacterium]
MRILPLVMLLSACGTKTVEDGDWTVSFNDNGSFNIDHAVLGEVLVDVRPIAGAGSAQVAAQFGAYRFDDVQREFTRAASFGRIRGRRAEAGLVPVEDADGELMGHLSFSSQGSVMLIDWAPDVPGEAGDGNIQSPLVGLSAACDADDHFLGLGAHAQDVDHVGEAFSLWTQEPGIGKTTNDDIPAEWPLIGAKHDTSFPAPVLLRPHRSQAIVVESNARIDVDLCSDGDRFEWVAWQSGSLTTAVLVSGTPKGILADVGRWSGLLTLPEPWVFGPWNDAIRGRDSVQAVADRLRAFGAPGTAIWTEDWKGAEENGFGYHLTGEWFVDDVLYPDVSVQALDLEDQGYMWLAYFSPFVFPNTQTWDEAIAEGAVLLDETGEPWITTGATFQPVGLVDLFGAAGQAFALERMKAALDLAFDGWMADYAEWLPVEASLSGGGDAFELHNAYPLMWQQVNQQAIQGTHAAFFVRSGWLGTSGLVPVVWAGDQRTSFDTDDGMPSVLPMGLGMAASGVPVFTHDVGGYQSVGNPPSDKELWFRWASLGAYSPILRTHHGAFEADNWKFDSDDETTEHWVAVATEHMRLFPYRYGLAAQAAESGMPMIVPIPFIYGGDWNRTDAWLLGKAMLVAPVMEAGAMGRDVELPNGTQWWSWPDLSPASSGFQSADLGQIPVFVAEGSVIPTFDVVPETLVPGASSSLISLEQADPSRTVYIFGEGGSFTEADGTSYKVNGASTGAAEVTQQLASGDVEVGGLIIQITGDVVRDYRLVTTGAFR